MERKMEMNGKAQWTIGVQEKIESIKRLERVKRVGRGKRVGRVKRVGRGKRVGRVKKVGRAKRVQVGERVKRSERGVQRASVTLFIRMLAVGSAGISKCKVSTIVTKCDIP